VSGRGQNGVTLDFAVEDTGIGMNQEQMDAIFSAFTQADNSATRRYGGVGLGLTLTRQMVKLMGGEIAVSSEEGKGSAFSFSCVFPLPISAPAAPPEQDAQEEDAQIEDAREEKAPEEETAKDAGAEDTKNAENDDDENALLRGMHVLLVEDNEVNALIATELLNAVDVEVTTAQNGSEALDRLAETTRTKGSPAFDMVLMDLQMPVMDGYEATKIIKETPEYRDIPVYALTAHALPEERERCLALGMNDHLTKPIDLDSFYGALREVALSKASKN
jgi:CheY-like chemotaxis protein